MDIVKFKEINDNYKKEMISFLSNDLNNKLIFTVNFDSGEGFYNKELIIEYFWLTNVGEEKINFLHGYSWSEIKFKILENDVFERCKVKPKQLNLMPITAAFGDSKIEHLKTKLLNNDKNQIACKIMNLNEMAICKTRLDLKKSIAKKLDILIVKIYTKLNKNYDEKIQ